MAEESQPKPPNQLPGAFEIATKGIAAGAIILYVVGYLVISIHHSTFGVMQIDPFKARIISAGGWFIVMTIIPVFFCLEMAGWQRNTWAQMSLITFRYWMACCTFSLSAAILFGNSDNSILNPNPWEILALVIAGLILTFPGLKKAGDIWVGLASVGATLVFVIWSVVNLAKAQMFTFSALILWFFGVGLFSLLELMNTSPPRIRDVRWFKTFFAALLLIFVFARVYFPHIRASWGGGGPVLVRVHTTKESTFNPDTEIRGLLIDEEEAGLYIRPDNSKSAIFIPRAAVALVSFAEADPKTDFH